MLYFQPFATVRLDRMSAAFGWSVADTEREVVDLIQRGEIQARVDSQNKVRAPVPPPIYISIYFLVACPWLTTCASNSLSS